MTDGGGGVSIRQLTTGVPGLDDVLGGGTGKTTLAHQIMFANATADRPGLYFTIVGEPALKMLRYQQQYSFFDPAKVNGMIRFSSLSAEVQRGPPGGPRQHRASGRSRDPRLRRRGLLSLGAAGGE